MNAVDMFVRAGTAILLLALALSSTPSLAQNWPQRTVKFLVPLGPGSGADVSARLLADHLAKRWRQPVVIENRPGGDGVIGLTAFLAGNDDHTLLFTPTGSFTTHPFLRGKVSYDQRALMPM